MALHSPKLLRQLRVETLTASKCALILTRERGRGNIFLGSFSSSSPHLPMQKNRQGESDR
jgi:hypothetical protein